MRRRQFIGLIGGATVAWPLMVGKPAMAQPTSKTPRVGILWPGAPPDKWDEAFRQGLRALGYVEGRNILFEYRWAEGKQERLAELAKELIQQKVDLIVTISALAIRAFKEQTTATPPRR